MRLDLFSWDEEWQAFALENLLIAKKLYDRGFEEAEKLDLECFLWEDVARLLFGRENVKDEPFVPEPPPECAEILEAAREDGGGDSPDDELLEKAENLVRFFEGFSHYRTEVRIPGLDRLRPGLVKKLGEELMSLAFTFEDWEQDTGFCEPYPHWYLFAGAGWFEERGKKAGIWFHALYDSYYEADLPPPGMRWVCEFLIELWDALVVSRVVRLKRRLPFGRLAFSPGRGCSGVKAGRGKTTVGIKERIREARREARSGSLA